MHLSIFLIIREINKIKGYLVTCNNIVKLKTDVKLEVDEELFKKSKNFVITLFIDCDRKIYKNK